MNIEKAIEKGLELKQRRIKYSMYGSRTGKDGTADCSGFIYECLVSGGAKPLNYVPNTDSLHSFLVNNGFKLIAESSEWNAKRGDVVIFGKKGSSGGANGHVVLFIEQYKIIHCTYKSENANGIYVESDESGCPYNWYFYVYRLQNNSTSKPTTPTKPTNTSNYTDSIVRDVINGKFGNGSQRKENLYNFVQNRVNHLLRGGKASNDSYDILAIDVIHGKFGNGAQRKENLYNFIQSKVNEKY